MIRSFDLPANFTSSDNVTLLLGIIDDLDVVYINSQLVTSSGFIDGTSKKTNPGPLEGQPKKHLVFSKTYNDRLK
jgi:hypothetical protein